MSDWLLLLSLILLVATGLGVDLLLAHFRTSPSLVGRGLRALQATASRHAPSSRTRLLLLPVGALALVFLAGAFSFNLFQMPSNSVTLPVEVIGPDGHTVSVQVNASSVSDVEHLYLKAHSIGYPYHLAEGRGYSVDKASIKLNDGSWVDVNNSNVECEEPEASVRCIEGPMHTVRFRIPISDLGSLNSGANTIHFRFNYADPSGELGAVSTGYRILDLELQTAGGTDRIDGTTFTWDDPGSWSAPDGYDSQSDVEDGKALWYKRDHMIDGWNGDQIKASCSDCHAESGYDLQYFAYSNESIVQRSRFHGLSESQGKKIAAYIRSIDIKTEDGQTIDPPGRPWNPPYQPGETSVASRGPEAPRTEGTSIDNMDPVYWAAGAGHKWALDKDAEMKKFLFPNGIVQGSITADGKLNMRELPVALQMPDWNEWLPAVHPMDVWGSDYTQSDSWQHYVNDVPDAVDSGDIGQVRWALQRLWKNLKKGFRPKDAPAPYDDQPDYGVADLARVQWGLTKSFEVMQPNHYEDDSQELYGSAAEPLQWPGLSRIVFDQAPHIQGKVKGSTSGIMDRYHDAAWYQHQMTLNPGSGISTSLKPMDWKYHYMHMNAPYEYGPHAWRTLASYAKGVQIANQLPDDYSSTEPEGWYLRHLTPAIIDPQHHWSGHLSELDSDDYRRALNVILKAFSDGITPEPLSEWERMEDQDGLEPSDWNPSRQSRYDRTTYPDHFWTALKNFGEHGVAYEVLKPLAEWSNKAWPNGDWMSLIDPYKDNPSVNDGPSNKAPSVSLAQPNDGATFTDPATIDLEADASDTDGNIDQVEFFVGDTSIGTSGSSPYSVSWSEVEPGHHTLTAVATDDAGSTTTSDAVDITVERPDGTVPLAPAVNYEYYEGSWSQLPDFDSMTPVDTDTTSGFSLDPAQQEDNFGFRYTAYLEVPADGSYTFYVESDDGSKVHVNGNLLIENDGEHGPQEKSGTVTLSKGYHPITVEYFEAAGGETLNLRWESASISKQLVPEDRLYPETPSSTTASQTLELQAGWNLVSTRVQPSDSSMKAVFGDVLSNMILAKDEAGRVFSPAYNVTGLNTWQSQEAYQVYMTSADSITIDGQAVQPDASIPLEKGWNLVPYYPSTEMPVEEAFSDLGESLVVVKDYAGRAYIPNPDYDVNEISTVEPGMGYKVYVDQADTLSYPTSTKVRASAQESQTDSTAARAATAKAQAASSSPGVSTSATILLEAPDVEEGTVIYAKAQDEVVGRSAVENGTALLTVRGKSRFDREDAPGAETGDELTFVAGKEREPVEVTQAESLLDGESAETPVTFVPDALLAVSSAPMPSDYALSKNHPNPVHSATTITYTLPEATTVTLSVYNVIGQRVATYVDGRREAGAHEVEIDASDLSSGVYFYRFEAGSYRESRKMTIVR